MSPVSSTPFPNLAHAQYMNLVTYRRDGRAVSTPVWFAEADGRLYVMTLANSGKIKRLRHTARVTVAPCKVDGRLTGEALAAQAHILPPEAHAQADAVLNRKYGILKRIYDLWLRLGRQPRTWIVVEPASP